MLRQRLNETLKQAMRDKDAPTVGTVRLILAAIKDRDIAARGEGRTEGISEQEIMELLQKMKRQRQESIEAYEQGGRLELAQREQDEIAVLERFLPRQLDEAETAAAVDEAIRQTDAQGLKDIGRVMGLLKGRHGGAMDFSKASALARARLS